MNTQDIIKDTATLYGCTVGDLRSRMRHRRYADARTVVSYILCSLLGEHYTVVGRQLNRTHATVIYFERKAVDWMRSPRLNPDGAAAIRQIAEKHHIVL